MNRQARQPRILVVDDDPIARMVLQSGLRSKGYFPVMAESVDAAQKVLGEQGIESFDAVITDYRMPEKDGLHFLRWLQHEELELGVIMMTAEGEKKLVAESLRSGVLDFLEKPLNLQQMLAALGRVVESTHQKRRLKEAEAAMLEISQVQQKLLHFHSGALENRVHVSFFPRRSAGGDFAAVFPLGHRKFLVVVTDVSGHDVKAAFISSYFQGMVRGMIERGADPSEVMDAFNRFLVSDWNRPGNWGSESQTETSMAVCAASFDFEQGIITTLNCGFPVPVRVQPDGRVSRVMQSGASPLGWFPDLYPETEVTAVAEVSRCYYWSDGVEDLAQESQVDPLSLVARIEASQQAHESAPDFMAAASDDIMVVRVEAGPDSGWQPLIFQRYAGDQAARIDEFQLLWQRSLELALPTLNHERLYDILLCTREAMLNALVHGCRQSAGLEATLQLSWSKAAPERIRVVVSDPGSGHHFDPAGYEKKAEAEMLDKHRGLIIITKLANSFRAEKNGAELQLEFNLS